MTLPAFSKWYPKRQVIAFNVLAEMIFTFIVFDDLTHFQKMFNQLSMYIMGFPCLTISYVRMSKHVTNRVTLLHHFYEKLHQKSHFTNFNHLWCKS